MWLFPEDHLVVKPEFENSFFSGTNVNITLEGHRHLRAVIGSLEFRKEYVKDEVKSWCEELKSLISIALTHPHMAYSVLFEVCQIAGPLLSQNYTSYRRPPTSTGRGYSPGISPSSIWLSTCFHN